MTTREKLTRRVIELIHDLPYEEAIKKEFMKGCIVKDKCYGKLAIYNGVDSMDSSMCNRELEIIGFPITLSRVMQAFSKLELDSLINCHINNYGKLVFRKEVWEYYIDWQLTTKDGATATLDDQTDETIEELYNLIK